MTGWVKSLLALAWLVVALIMAVFGSDPSWIMGAIICSVVWLASK